MRLLSTRRPKPAEARTSRDKARHTSRTRSAPGRRPESAARHSGAWCRRSSSRSRQNREFRTHSPARTPATAWRAANAPDHPVAESPERAPAEWPRAGEPPRPTPAHTSPAAERSQPARLPTAASAPTRWIEFSARRKDSKLGFAGNAEPGRFAGLRTAGTPQTVDVPSPSPSAALGTRAYLAAKADFDAFPLCAYRIA